MKNIKTAMITAMATVFTLLATTLASSACWWGWYQPEEPTSLRKE